MFSNKSANSKALAVAFVSMLMLCSFAMVITSESDAEPGASDGEGDHGQE